jgi:hypothetical protein
VDMLNSRNPLIVKLLGGDDLRLILGKLYNHSLSYLLRAVVFWRKLAPLYRFLLKLIGGMYSR